MTEFAGKLVEGVVTGTYRSFTNLDWIRLAVGSILCGFVCLWTAGLLGVPREPGFDGSLLASGSPVVGVIVAGIAVVMATIVGAVIAGSIRSEAGLFCACAGLMALAIRSGPIRPVLQYAVGPAVFWSLAIEALLLVGIIVGVWLGMNRLFAGTPLLLSNSPAAPNEEKDAALGNQLWALGVQIISMSVLEVILIQSDAHAQALCGVALSAFVAVVIAYNVMPLPDGIWYWTGPLVVGMLGYLLAYFNDGSVATGDIHGWSAAMARATPLDYASAGTAAAMLGYWCARRWAQPEDGEAQDPVAV